MRRTLTVIASLVLAATGVAVAPTASYASNSGTPASLGRVAPKVTPALAPSGCSSGALCFWRDNNTSGGSNGPGQLYGRNPDWRAFSHSSCQSGTWDNCASYVYNHGVNCAAVIWDGYGYTYGADGAVVIDRNTGYDLPQIFMNDAVSSNSWVRPDNYLTDSTCIGPTPVVG